MKKFLFLFLLLFIPFSYADQEVLIYKNSACGHCSVYLNEFTEYLEEHEIGWQEKNILGDKDALRELDEFTKEREIPYELQGHMVIVFNSLVLEGHVPLPVIHELLEKYPDYNFPPLVLYQDSMDDLVTEYTLLDDKGIKDCTVRESVENCLEKEGTQKKIFDKSLLFLVLFNGLLAGIHPCTISVLLFFIAFLFTIRRTRIGIFKVGLAYISGIFVAYFGIGIGLFKVITFSNSPHFAAKIGAFLVLGLGLINILGYFYKKKISFGLPKILKPKVVDLMQKSTIPAALIVGLIVGICSFGCTAGIYLSIVSFLLVKSSYVQGLSYLILYNLMFILPLLLILFISSNKKIVERVEKLEKSEKEYVKLVAGIIMVLLALFLFWIVYGGAG